MTKAQHERRSVNAPPQLTRDVSRIFQRGQLWYWEDPIYSNKRVGYSVPDKVSGPRFNRYVVIVQNPSTASQVGIVVVPCSSRPRNGEHDVEIPINHLLVDDYTYAKCQSIMNVDPRTLTRYVCTIPDEAMAIIDGEIIKMLTCIRNALTEDQFLMHGVNLNNDSVGKYQDHVSPPKAPIEDDFEDEPVEEDDPDDAIDEEGCQASTKSSNPLLDIIALGLVDGKLSARSIVDAKLGIGLNAAGKYIQELLELGFLIPHTNPGRKAPLDINIGSADRVLEALGFNRQYFDEYKNTSHVPPHTRKIWDNESMKQFIEDYNSLNLKEVSKKYGLSEGTVVKYYSRFKARIKNAQEESKKETGTSKNFRKKFLSMMDPSNVVKGSSIIAKEIENYLRFRHLGNMCSNPNMDKEEFCKTIGSIVYYAILQALGITVSDGSTVESCPAFSAISYPESEAWEFLNTVGLLDDIGDWTKYADVCKEKGVPVRLPGRFMETLSSKLRRCSLLNNQKAEAICNLVKNRFI